MVNRWLLFILFNALTVRGAIVSSTSCGTGGPSPSQSTGPTDCLATGPPPVMSGHSATGRAHISNFGLLNVSIQVFADQGEPEVGASARADYSVTDTVIFFGADYISWGVGGGINDGYNAIGGGSFQVGNVTKGYSRQSQPSPTPFTTPSGIPLDMSLRFGYTAGACCNVGSTSGSGALMIYASGRNNSSNTEIPITFASKNGYSYGFLGTQIPWDTAFDATPPAPTPEPATWLLIASATPILAFARRRHRSGSI